MNTTKIMFPTATIDVALTVEVTFEVPSVDFSNNALIEQLRSGRHGWLRGVRLDAKTLAEVIGMENRNFLNVCGYQGIDINKITITKYDDEGKVLTGYEEPR